MYALFCVNFYVHTTLQFYGIPCLIIITTKAGFQLLTIWIVLWYYIFIIIDLFWYKVCELKQLLVIFRRKLYISIAWQMF